jgi:hypothetical protein
MLQMEKEYSTQKPARSLRSAVPRIPLVSKFLQKEQGWLPVLAFS